MRVPRLVTAFLILILAVLDAPQQARALLFDFLPSDFLAFGASEPVMLLLTGLLFLSLARIGVHASRTETSEQRTIVVPVSDVSHAQPVAVHSAKRAA